MSTAIIEHDFQNKRSNDRHEVAEFMPALSAGQVIERYNAVVQLYRDVMKSGKDYGVIPGSLKPSLLKAGAEKLCTLFGLAVEEPEIMTEAEDWTGAQHGGEAFFYYKIRQRLTRHGQLVAAQFASANSWESKHRYRWVGENEIPPGLVKSSLRTRGGKVSEFTFSVDKAETTGQYGKPVEYWKRFTDAISNGTARKTSKTTSKGKVFEAWEIESVVYRVPNADMADVVNTIQKMAQKRALVAATLIATNCSEFFTQDIEEAEESRPQAPEPAPPPAPEPIHDDAPPEVRRPRPTKKVGALLEHHFGRLKFSPAEILSAFEKYGVTRGPDLTPQQADELVSHLARIETPGAAVEAVAAKLKEIVKEKGAIPVETPAGGKGDKPATRNQLAALSAHAARLKMTPVDVDDTLAPYGAMGFAELTVADADEVIRQLAEIEPSQTQE